jgi:cell division protein FtsQ
MARKSGATILQEELYPPPGEPERESFDDARLVDLDVEEESPFLRGQKRVSARRGPLPKKAVSWLKWSVMGVIVLSLAGVGGAAVYRYGERSWRFRIESSDYLEISGTHNVPHAQVMEVLGGDIGRNIFFVPLNQRKAQLEKIPWVESASVMRFVPNRLVVEIHERTPIAFARVGSRISLIDAGGTLMELPSSGKQKYSFPVILGMNPGEPLSTRAARMKIYNELIRQLDSEGAHYSQDLSEVDITDQEDVKVLANDPAGAVLVHLGSSDFLSRYKIYVTHLRAWRQQFDKLESVDLRYEHQIIVNPDMQNAAKAPQLTPAAAKAAMAAGVKPTALIHVVTTKPTTAATTAAKPAAKAESLATEKATLKSLSKPSAKKVMHRRPKHRTTARKTVVAKTKTPANAMVPTEPHPQRAPTSTPPKAASSTSKRAALNKKKPSAAVAKNQVQQDRP